MDGIDVLLAKVGVVASLLLLGLQLFASQVFLLVIPLAIGTGSGLYLLADNEMAHARPTLSSTVAGYLPAVVGVGLASIVLLTHVFGPRTDVVYLATGAVGTAIFGQILLVDDDAVPTGPILVQILLVAVAIRLTALYSVPGYVGMDIWTHATVFIDGIVRDGSLAALSESKYLVAPFYHAIGAVGALVFGGVRNGIYLSVGILMALSALFVYATAKVLVPARWALLATALYAFSDQFIRWGIHVIPTSLGLVFFLALLYLVTRLLYAGAQRWVVGLLAACSLAVVFTHQVSTTIALIFLGIAAAVAVGLRFGSGAALPDGTRNAFALGSVFSLTLVITLVAWANAPFSAGSTFLWREIAVITSALTEDAGFLNLASRGEEALATTAGPESLFDQLVPYIELFGFMLLLAAAIVGGLLLLRWRVAPDVALTHVVTGGALFVLVFGLSIFGVRVLLPGRWMAFLYASLALLAAIGLYHLFRTAPTGVVLAVFVVLAVGYPITMVTAEKATLDSPAFDDQHKRFAYNEAEIAAVGTISELSPPSPGTTVGTDHPYTGLFERYGGYKTANLVLGNSGPTEADTVVYRDYQTSEAISFRVADGASPETEPISAAVCPAGWNKAYANDNVWLCTDTADPEASE